MACAKQKEVVVYETSGWTTHLTLTDVRVKGNFTACGFSHCGKFVAAGTTQGELAVWSGIDGKRVDGKTEGEAQEPITSISWNPNGLRQFVYADKSGQLSCVNVEQVRAREGAANAMNGLELEDDNGRRFVGNV